MAVRMDVPDEAVQRLRPLFRAVEGDCEVWLDDEIVRRLLIRGAMEYAKSSGQEWDDVQALARELRELL